jgi:hypothetical protein
VTVFKLGDWEPGAAPGRGFRYWRSQSTDRIAAFVRPSGDGFAWKVYAFNYATVAEGDADTEAVARERADAVLAGLPR